MKKARILLALGIWVTFLPYLGFPYKFKQFLFVLTGLSIVYLAYIMYKQNKISTPKKEPFENFSENTDFSENNDR